DVDNQDGVRPVSIVVVLSNDTGVVAEYELNDANGWKHTFKDLPVYVNEGALINYTVVEKLVPADYKAVTVKVDGYNYIINNTHVPEVTNVSVVKVWNDKDNQDGVRPDEIVVELLADGVVVNSAVLNASNGWSFTFAGLDVYKHNGTVIVYTVNESSVPAGYSVSIDSDDRGNWTVTNTHVPAVTDVSVVKVWNDNSNQDGVRPVNVTVVLVAEGNIVDSAVLDASNDWSASFKNLPVYNAGELIEYSVEEVGISNYTSVVSNDTAYDWTVTNTHVPAVTDVSVVKVWNDNSNQDGVRPVNVTVVLVADGNVVDSAVLDASNDWSASFTDLPVYDAGNVIVYSVEEVSVANYTSVISVDSAYDFTVVNTHVPVVTNVSIVKVWNDADNNDGVRPVNVTVVLVADGSVVDSAVLDASNDWSASFTDLPVYDAGNVIVYSVEEVSVANYTSVISVDSAYDFTVVNTHVPVVTVVNVTKVWNDNNNQDGVRPVNVTVVLVADGSVVGSAVLDASNDWSASFTDLPVYDDGEVIEYSVEEVSVANYTSVISVVGDYDFSVVNTHVPVVTVVNVTKVWRDNDDQDGVRPVNVTVVLVADGSVVGSAVLDASNDWSASFTDLPVYDDGEVIEYSVEEVSVANYTSVISVVGDYDFSVVNTHVPVVTVVNVTKVWRDNDDQDGVRPVNVTVVLVADGNVVGTTVLDASNDWSASFTDLPVYDAGEVIEYSVEEVSVANYTSVISVVGDYDFTVVNTHVPVVTAVNITKVWMDNNNTDGVRPSSVTVVLVADGNVVGFAVLDASDDWSASFENLPVYKDGNMIEYSVEEISVANYTTAISVNGAHDFTVVNTHVPVITAVNITKVWKDTEEKEKTSTPEIEIILYADGVPVANATLFPGNDWKLSFDDLPVYHDGKVINYTIGVIENNHTVNMTSDEGNFTILTPTSDNNQTNDTVNNTNTTNEVDDTVPVEPEVPVNPENPDHPVPHKQHVPKHIKHETLATGNPIVLLLLALFIPFIRRKEN
ncbi:Cna B-type domain-containing protein, partial [Methanobrevibacter sp.]|uniref:Cna B-type domain-containing protein n=1 Tax=Methanobrevibacter sp. TaxID=66852 RepID=UPI0025D3347D